MRDQPKWNIKHIECLDWVRRSGGFVASPYLKDGEIVEQCVSFGQLREEKREAPGPGPGGAPNAKWTQSGYVLTELGKQVLAEADEE